LYKDGVPEDMIDTVAKSLRVRVTIADMFGENKRFFNEADGFAKRFVYRNVRWNHLEAITSEWTAEEISNDDMHDLHRALREEGKAFVLSKNGAGLITRLDTPHGRFTLKDPDRTIFQDARDRYYLDGAAIDAIKEPNLAEFCQTACRVTSHAKIQAVLDDDPEDLSVLDLATAYARAEECPYFQGYCSTISDVRRVMLDGAEARAFLAANPGLFCVDQISLSACTETMQFYLSRLQLPGIHSLLLPSPELLCLYDLGVRFRVRSGAWGPPLPSIDWAGCHLLDKCTGPFFSGISRYKVWCGQLGHTNRGIKRTWFPGTEDWAAYMRSLGYDALFYDIDGDICIERPAKRSPANNQLFAFITAYTRIHVLLKLKEFDPSVVRGLQLDSIVFVGDAPAGSETGSWKLKPQISADTLVDYCEEGWYGFGRGYNDAWITAGPCPVRSDLAFLEGAGGSGKSHSILGDIGFRDVLFAAPTWSLVCFMGRKYKRAGTSVHRLAGEYLNEETGKQVKCRAYHEEHNRFPAVVFVDEATMIDKSMLEAVIKTYKRRSKIIIAGDIRVTGVPAAKPPVWFQCRNRTAVFDPREYGCSVTSYDSDFRASGPLVDLKKALRAAMVDIFLTSSAEDPGDDEIDARLVTDQVKTLFEPFVATTDDCLDTYAPGDTILVGTHELGDGWTEALKERDERYRVTRHIMADVVKAQSGEGADVLLTGDITNKKVPNAEFCLAFTIHSFQGKTFTGKRLWIDARRVWDYAMLYTAISRCQTADQIRIMFE
jgi:hypothetical protein